VHDIPGEGRPAVTGRSTPPPMGTALLSADR